MVSWIYESYSVWFLRTHSGSFWLSCRYNNRKQYTTTHTHTQCTFYLNEIKQEFKIGTRTWRVFFVRKSQSQRSRTQNQQKKEWNKNQNFSEKKMNGMPFFETTTIITMSACVCLCVPGMVVSIGCWYICNNDDDDDGCYDKWTFFYRISLLLYSVVFSIIKKRRNLYILKSNCIYKKPNQTKPKNDDSFTNKFFSSKVYITYEGRT